MAIVNLSLSQPPPAASLSRTTEIASKVAEGARKNPAVENAVTIAGYDFLSGAQKSNSAITFVTLKDWSQRRDPALDARNLPQAFAGLNADFRDGYGSVPMSRQNSMNSCVPKWLDSGALPQW